MTIFNFKLRTVASIMESFRTTIIQLDDIIQANALIKADLASEAEILQLKVEDVDLEIYKAEGVRDRMNDLVFGPSD